MGPPLNVPQTLARDMATDGRAEEVEQIQRCSSEIVPDLWILPEYGVVAATKRVCLVLVATLKRPVSGEPLSTEFHTTDRWRLSAAREVHARAKW